MNRTNDIQAVSKVIRAYVSGTADRDVAALRALFHETAVMSGYLGPNLLLGAPEPFFAHVAETPHEGDSYAAEIVHVSVVGRTATVRLVEDNLYGLSFVNDFHLLQIDGSWTIMSKLFHHD